MRISKLSLPAHLFLLAVFCGVATSLWMMPVLFTGYGPFLPRFGGIQEFLKTGLVLTGDGRLMVLVFAFAHRFLEWTDLTGWSFVNTGIVMAALFPWWWAAFRFFDIRTAWVSTVVLAFLPHLWTEGISVSGYNIAFFFLFLGFAFFAEFHIRRRLLTFVLSGLCLGAAIASKDAFITFLPWFVCFALWVGRSQWKRSLVETTVFLLCTGIAYTAPLTVNALRPGLSLTERIVTVLPIPKRETPTTGHFYPDEYTAQYAAEEYQQEFLENYASRPAVEQLEWDTYRLKFGVGDTSFLSWVRTSVWLFIGAFPSAFLQDTTGGLFLWIFVITGMVVLWRTRPQFLMGLMGLWISMEAIIRLLLHFRRPHILNVLWIFALLAACGMAEWSDALSVRWKRSAAAILCALTVLTAGQLIQTNRKQFARLYLRSDVPAALAGVHAYEDLDVPALAHPRSVSPYFRLSSQHRVVFEPETIEKLLEKRELPKAFDLYDISHVMGYEQDLLERIRRADSSVTILPLPDMSTARMDVTPLMRWILNIVR